MDRYDNISSTSMFIIPDGRYCLHSDVEALEKENKKFRDFLQGLIDGGTYDGTVLVELLTPTPRGG